MILDLFYWQFVESPKQLFIILKRTLKYIVNLFSIGFLFRTLFAPWKRDITEIVNPSLQDRFQMLINNLISRFIGFIVRLFTIIAGIVVLCGALVLSIVVFIAWILLPFIIIYLIIMGFNILYI